MVERDAMDVMGVFIMLITVFSIAWPGRRYCTARAVFCRRAGCKRGTLSEKFALKNISVIFYNFIERLYLYSKQELQIILFNPNLKT